MDRKSQAKACATDASGRTQRVRFPFPLGKGLGVRLACIERTVPIDKRQVTGYKFDE